MGDTFSSDDKLKDLFHRGLSSHDLQERTARKLWDNAEKLSFTSLVTYTDTEEEAMRRTSNLMRSYQETDNQRQPQRQYKTDLAPRQMQQIENTQKDRMKCFNCNRFGHTAKECRIQYQNQGALQQGGPITYQTQDHQDLQTTPNGQRKVLIGKLSTSPSVEPSSHTPPGTLASRTRPITQTSPASPIQGKMLLNKTVVSYLFDTGAELTVISRETYNKLNTEKNPIILREYSGPRICSVDGHVDVLGAINIGTCVIATDCTISNAKMIVLDKIQQHDCLMGRDLIQRIPILNGPTQSIKSKVKEFSDNLLANLESLLATQSDQEEKTWEGSSYDEGEIVIFPGFTDNKPTIIRQKEKPEMELSDRAPQPEVETVRRQIQQELNESN